MFSRKNLTSGEEDNFILRGELRMDTRKPDGEMRASDASGAVQVLDGYNVL